MKIIFDLRSTGLGNNGGSSTLIKSGNTLVDLGHNVTFIDGGKNQHTWTKLKAKHKIVKRDKQIPDADIIMATGYRSVGNTLNAPKRCGVKFHYIRGWEIWNMNEKQINKKILQVPTIKIVNSFCLRDKLRQFSVESYIIRPGYDFDLLNFIDSRDKKSYTIIGGLFNHRHQTKRTDWIIEVSKILKKKYKLELHMFGVSKSNDKNIDRYFKSPSEESKNLIYNKIDIWLAPTMNEGLHICPAEAALTGCPIVGTDAEMSGMQDYLIHNETGLVSKNDLQSFIEQVDILVNNKKLRKSLGKNVRKKIISLGSRHENMKKMVKLFERHV